MSIEKVIQEIRDAGFYIGQRVYLKTDPYQVERMIVCVMVTPNGCVYNVSYLEGECQCYGVELSKERDIMKLTS